MGTDIFFSISLKPTRKNNLKKIMQKGFQMSNSQMGISFVFVLVKQKKKQFNRYIFIIYRIFIIQFEKCEL